MSGVYSNRALPGQVNLRFCTGHSSALHR
uniref:Uncharacterized protein n=1 Tax=Anguilla anguilla TaxID=7936 RepID=A0A0E9SS00_ANGAN